MFPFFQTPFISPWWSAATVAALLPASMGLLSAMRRRDMLAAEPARKLLHVEMGLVTLSFPWLIGQTEVVLVLALLATAWFIGVRRCAALRAIFGGVLDGVGRHSWGEVYFTVGACLTFLLAAGNTLRYCLPMAILVFADTAAALAAPRDPARRHSIGINGKSVEGCAAFVAVALVCAIVALSLRPEGSLAQTFSVALLLALDTAVLEVLGRHGADNLLIPVVAAFLLPELLHAGQPALLAHLGAVVALMVLWCHMRQWP